jgi:quinolinate synthase
MHVWMGECHVHAGISPENIALQRSVHPEAEFLVHPECGCSTSVLEAMSAGDVDSRGVHVLSTEGMIRRPAQSPAQDFIVATEVGILHRLKKENPDKRFFAANDRASCAYMKVTTLPKVLVSLETLTHHITVPPHIAARAQRAIERMVSIGGPAPTPLLPGEDDPGE